MPLPYDLWRLWDYIDRERKKKNRVFREIETADVQVNFFAVIVKKRVLKKSLETKSYCINLNQKTGGTLQKSTTSATY